MNREFLEGLGLEKDTIDAVMKEHGKTVNSTKEQLETITTERDELKEQLISRDEQLESLKEKATGNEDLQSQIQELQSQNEQIKEEYEHKIQQQQFDHTLKDALTNANVRNPKAVQALLDLESIKLDGDKLLGLDDQLKEVKESDPYLFEEEKSDDGPKPSFSTGQHQKETSGEPSNLGEALAQHYSK